jgi:NAD(P)-dependent dehydrogenase (short-subunit alcohol dehydrogenase family)
MKRVAVVTGGTSGIGYAVCEALAQHGVCVVQTGRAMHDGVTLAAEMSRRLAAEVVWHPLDVTISGDVVRLHAFLLERFGRVDILINNAGVHIDRGQIVEESSIDGFVHTIETNLLGPYLLIRELLPLMRRANYGRIVNVSSGMGRMTTMRSGSVAYRVSKAGLNALTIVTAAETAGTNIKVNCVRPGQVKTNMGSQYSKLTAQEAAAAIVPLALLDDDGPSGQMFSEGAVVSY